MKYFKNTELAKLYHVSEKTVRNWITAAQEGKLDLQLHIEGGRPYISNTGKNTNRIEQLVEKGRKYKNRRGYKTVTPSEAFYKMYSQKQILDIVSNLSIHHEIPVQYTYIDGGAYYWDQYAKHMASDTSSNVLKKTIELMDRSSENIDDLIENRRVNIVDLGPGNGLPVHSMITRMLKQGRMGRYIALDCSKDMLGILKQNISDWFGGKVRCEAHVRDFSTERFDDLISPDYAGNDPEAPVNIVLLLGGTLSNQRHPERILQLISSCLGPNDLLIHSGFLDTPKTRRYFDFDVSRSSQKLTPKHRLILDFLNIDESLYGVERKYDRDLGARSISFNPTVDISLEINVGNNVHRVELKKGEPILIWRHWHSRAVEVINLFDQNDFDVMQATKSSDGQYILTTSKIKRA
jgi:uncharacterized SAM-dependent methyltransferase